MSDTQEWYNCEVLSLAVAVIMAPDSGPEERKEAQQVCDEFKQKSKMCVTYGLQLAAKNESIPVRHFGLQAIAHYVRHRWDEISIVERRNVRDRFIKHMSAGGSKPSANEDPCIKEATARVVVEIIKQDWPHNWFAMLTDLNGLSQRGPLMAELVMLVLLRLAEEVMTLETSPLEERTVRVNRMLIASLKFILGMVQGFLQETGDKYCGQAWVACRIRRAALNTLTGYMDLLEPSYIEETNFKLLNVLWGLLRDPELQLEASECLLVAIKRISNFSKTPLLELFDFVAIPYIFPFPRLAAGEVLTERHYSFMKNRCHLVCMFGEQLCRTLALEQTSKTPPNFEKYLVSLLDFTTFGSPYMRFLTHSTWKELFTHALLSRNPIFLSVLPKYLLATRMNLANPGFPSKNDSPGCEYSRFDFGTDEDCFKFMQTFRVLQRQLVRVACQLDPGICFQVGSQWLKRLTSSVDAGHPNYRMQWEATTVFMNLLIASMLKNEQRKAIQQKEGLELLHTVQNFKSKDPVITAHVAKNIATLMAFLKIKNETLPHVLTKLLEVIEHIKAPKELSLSHTRRNACFRIKRLCQNDSQFYLPLFEGLFIRVNQLLHDELLQLTRVETNALTNAMVLLINEFNDYERQKAFLEELLAPFASLWLSESMQRVFADPEEFLSYVGVDQLTQLDDNIVKHPTNTNQNRLGIIHCLATVLVALRCSLCPTDPEKAKAGGFVIGVMASGKPVCRNPCVVPVLKLLDTIFVLIRTLHNLYLPQALLKMGNGCSKALELMEVENTSIHTDPLSDIQNASKYEANLHEMQDFFSTLYYSCFDVLGWACSDMKQDFYSIKNIVDQLLKSVFVNLEHIPHNGLLYIMRVFLKPMVYSCPPRFYEPVVCPIMGLFLPSLHGRLSREWHTNRRSMSNKQKTAGQITKQEKLERLTDEVMEFITDCCLAIDSEDTIILIEESSVPNNLDKLYKINDTCSRGADVAVASAVTNVDCEFKAACSQDAYVAVASAVTNVDCEFKDACSRDADITVASAVTNVDCEIKEVCSQDADVTVAAAVPDLCCVTNEDDDSTVSSSESDDVCMHVDDAPTHAFAAAHNVACSVLNEKADSGGIAEESNVACNFSTKLANSLAESDNACIVVVGDAAPKAVAAETNPDCRLFNNNADVSSESDGELAAGADSEAVAAETNPLRSRFNDNADVLSESDDGEMAAEVSQSYMSAFTEYTPLTKLGICLLKNEDVCSAVFTTASSSLVWEGLTCYKAATRLCWPLLHHVILEHTHEDIVTYFFTMVLKGLYMHGSDKLNRITFHRLAFQIYKSLRPQYAKLHKVMRSIPNINPWYLEMFDERLLNPTIQKPDRKLQHYFRGLLIGCIQGNSLNDSAHPFKKSRKCPPSYKRSKNQRFFSNPMTRPLPYRKHRKFKLAKNLPVVATEVNP